MKNSLLLGMIVLTSAVTAQTTLTLDENNARARISDNGFFFKSEDTGEVGYEIPKGDSVATSWGMTLWMGGLNDDGELHAACNRWEPNQDMFAGPIADDYTSDYYADNFGSSIWKVTRDEIEYHMGDYTATGYEPIDAIANWPGNGDPTEGVAEQLAPFVDVDGDGVYNPMNGDYPYIQGDAAVYVIMNDAADFHANTGANPLNAEIHLMFYQFETTDDLNNTTFMNATVYNRGSVDFSDFRFGVYNDFKIGFSFDDFCGSDSLRRFIYGYNGSSSDSQYGDNPPAFGTQLLNKEMGAAMYFNNSGAPNGDPSAAFDYYNYMQPIWRNGQPVYYGGNGFNAGITTYETNCMFTGDPLLDSDLFDGWTEITSGNPSDDRRMMIATTDMDFPAGEKVCIDFAFIFSQNGSNNLENASDLKNVADVVQDFYDENVLPCSNIVLGTESLPHEEVTLDLYPNPTFGELSIQTQGIYQLNLLSMDGKLMQNLGEHEGPTTVHFDVENGIYLLELSTGHARLVRKVQVLR